MGYKMGGVGQKLFVLLEISFPWAFQHYMTLNEVDSICHLIKTKFWSFLGHFWVGAGGGWGQSIFLWS